MTHSLELTDAQVLAQLKTKRARLKVELEKIELAISAYTAPEPDPYDELPYLLDDEPITDEMAQAMITYNHRDSFEKKILFALGKLKRADAGEIAEYLIRVDGRVKVTTKFCERITYLTSRMSRLGKIEADKVGKKNVYRLKD